MASQEETGGEERLKTENSKEERKAKKHILSLRYLGKKKKNIFIIDVERFRNGKFLLLPYGQVVALAAC